MDQARDGYSCIFLQKVLNRSNMLRIVRISKCDQCCRLVTWHWHAPTVSGGCASGSTYATIPHVPPVLRTRAPTVPKTSGNTERDTTKCHNTNCRGGWLQVGRQVAAAAADGGGGCRPD
eukprot:9150996-Pyramimonas_sp.AAC.1